MGKRRERSIWLIAAVLGVLAASVAPAMGAPKWQTMANGTSETVRIQGVEQGLEVSIAFFEGRDGAGWGQAQYLHVPTGQAFRLKVDRVCTGSASGKPIAVAVGPVFSKDGSDVVNGFGLIGVIDRGDSGDGLRVLFDKTEAFVNDKCVSLADKVFPATVVTGDFRIVSK